MTIRLEPGQLAELGLSTRSLGELERIAWPEEHVGLGRGKVATHASIAALVLSGYANQAFAEVGSDVATRLGIRIRQLRTDPQVVMLSAPSDSRPTIRTTQAVESAVARDRDDPDTLLVDLRESGPSALLMDDGRGLLLRPVPEGLEIGEILHQPVGLEPLPSLDAPLQEWCADCRDSWLVELIHARTAHLDPWSEGVAAGLYARLLEPGPGTPTRASEVDEDVLRPRVWARSLDQAQSDGLEHLGLAECDRLLAGADDLGRRAACDDPAWVQELLDLCAARDDLEGVRLLLRARRSGERLDSSLGPLDEAGHELMATLPVRVGVADERLRRVWLADPDVWWVRPYAWSRGHD